jgi:hypothetical protein
MDNLLYSLFKIIMAFLLALGEKYQWVALLGMANITLLKPLSFYRRITKDKAGIRSVFNLLLPS